MNGGMVTSRSAGGTDFSPSNRSHTAREFTRETTSPEPASNSVTATPVRSVNFANCDRYQAPSPLAL